MSTPDPIPEGYRRDHRDRLIPEAQVKPIDQLRDDLVRNLVERAIALHEQIARAKGEFFTEIAAFLELSAEQYGAVRGGEKGNVTLRSYDGSLMVVRAIAETIRFDERLQTAQQLIEQCLDDWTSDSRSELRTIVQAAFAVDQSNSLRVQQVLALRRFNIEDERWQRAMAAISDSMQVIGSKAYVRFYTRMGKTDRYAQIPLDIAAVPLR